MVDYYDYAISAINTETLKNWRLIFLKVRQLNGAVKSCSYFKQMKSLGYNI